LAGQGFDNEKSIVSACVKSTEGEPMTKYRKLAVSGAAALVAMSLGSPSYAHWGAVSAASTYGVTQYCNHADAGNTNVRRARVRLLWNAFYVSYEGGGYYIYWDTIQIKNVSTAGRIDALAWYVGPSVPPGQFFDSVQANDINVNDSRTVGNWWETNGQPNVSAGYCLVTNG
jgi:hypothetical protein